MYTIMIIIMYIVITTTYTRNTQSTNNMQLRVSAQQSHKGEPQCSTSSRPGACFLGSVFHSILATPRLRLHPNESTRLRVSALGERVGQSSRCILCGSPWKRETWVTTVVHRWGVVAQVSRRHGFTCSKCLQKTCTNSTKCCLRIWYEFHIWL